MEYLLFIERNSLIFKSYHGGHPPATDFSAKPAGVPRRGLNRGLKRGILKGIEGAERAADGALIVGVGIDIIEVDRVSRAISNPRFVDRVYTRAEQELLQARRLNAQTAAGSFAAKEAAAKALGTGFGAIHWTEIEVLRTAEGRPHLVLYGSALSRFHALGGHPLWVSISHTAAYAAAQVILEGETP